MTGRVIAIGDVHGCAAALRALVVEVCPGSDDTIVMLGDCIDRGPDSRGVIEQLLGLRERCRVMPILGNHEEMMLNYLDGRPQPDDWVQFGGAQTLASYGAQSDSSVIPEEHVAYIRTWGDCYETPTHFFVHGGYDAKRPIARQHWQTMRWHSLNFGIPGPHISGKTAVVGHTSQKGGDILDVGHLLCIDTYCWGGGWLTGYDATSGHVWQVDRHGETRHDLRTAQAAEPS